MNRKRLLYVLLALAAFLSIGLTFVELFSDLRALGRQEAGPYMPIISFDGLMSLFRSLNLIIIVFILHKLTDELPEDESRRRLVRICLHVFLFLSILSPFGAVLEAIPLFAIVSFFGLVSSYMASLILLALVMIKTQEHFDEVSILLLLIGLLLPLIILSYLIGIFGPIFLLTVGSRCLLFIMMFILLVRFSKKAIAG